MRRVRHSSSRSELVLAAVVFLSANACSVESIGDAAAVNDGAEPVGTLAAPLEVMNNTEKQDALLGIMEAFVPRAEEFWRTSLSACPVKNIAEVPGCFVTESDGVPEDRGQSAIAYIYATLLTARPNQSSFAGVPRQTVLDHAVDQIQYLAFSNDLSDSNQSDDPYEDPFWGGPECLDTHCEAPYTAMQFGWAAQWLWGEFSDRGFVRTKIEEVIAAEANILVGWGPQDGSLLSTYAEENAWSSSGLAVAAAIFPNHANQADWASWDEFAKRFAYNSSSRAADEALTSTFRDGKSIAEWVTTDNLFNDYTLGNHGFFHPVYSQGVFTNLADDAIFYAGTGRPVPQAFSFRLQEVWDKVVAPLATDDGDINGPAGTDWVTHDYQHIAYFAYVASKLQRNDASVLESRAINNLARRQAHWGTGSLFNHGRVGYEADVVRNVAAAWWVHELFPATPVPTESQYDQAREASDDARNFAEISAVSGRMRDAMVSVNWGPEYATAHVIPSARDYVDDPVLVQYTPGAGLEFNGDLIQYDCDCKEDYLSTAGTLNNDSDSTPERRFALTAFPDGTTMMLDRGSGKALSASFENDPSLIAGDRSVRSAGGETLDVLSGTWFNVADRYGMAVAGGLGMTVTVFDDRFPNKTELSDPLFLIYGDGSNSSTARNRGAIVLPLATRDETEIANSTLSQPTVPSDWSALVARARDNTERIAVAHWGSSSTTLISATSSRGAPIFNRPTALTKSGSAPAVGASSWTLGFAGNGVASAGEQARFYVDAPGVTVTPIPLTSDRIAIQRTAGGAATIGVKYVDQQSALRSATGSLTNPQIGFAHALDQGVAFVVASASTEASGRPASQVYDTDVSSQNYWSSTAVNLSTTPQTLALTFDKAIDIGGLTMTPRANNGPKNYEIQSSNDGTTWTTVPGGTVTNASASASTTKTFTSPIKTRRIRLRITAGWASGTTVQVAVQELAIKPPTIDIDAVWPTLKLAKGGRQTARFLVTNNGSSSAFLTLGVSAPSGVTATAPASVTVPANGSIPVEVKLSGSTATSGAGTLTLSQASAVSEPVTLQYTSNLALNGIAQEVSGSFPQIWASSNETPSAYPPENGNDGNTSSFWVCGLGFATHSQTLTVNFGDPVTVGRVIMTPRTNYGPKSYQIQTSMNGHTWTTRATETNIPNAARTTTFTPVTAQFIQIRIHDSYDTQSPPRNSQIAEFEVRPN